MMTNILSTWTNRKHAAQRPYFSGMPGVVCFGLSFGLSSSPASILGGRLGQEATTGSIDSRHIRH